MKIYPTFWKSNDDKSTWISLIPTISLYLRDPFKSSHVFTIRADLFIWHWAFSFCKEES